MICLLSNLQKDGKLFNNNTTGSVVYIIHNM